MELLEVALPSSDPDPHQAFRAMMQERGIRHSLLPWDQVQQPDRIQRFEAAIHRADALWFSDRRVLDDPLIAREAEARLKAGARGLVTRNALDWELLGRHGVEPLGVQVAGPQSSDEGDEDEGEQHPRLIDLDREEHGSAFRDSELFNGVRKLALAQPNALSLRGLAPVGVVALPLPPFIALESDRVVDLPKPELPVMAVLAPQPWTGRLIAINAGVFHDPFRNGFGFTWPGINGADNRRLAENVLGWLQRNVRSSPLGWETAYGQIVAVETAILRITQEWLAPEWFSKVPEKTKTQCEDRRKSEGDRAPIQAYLTLTDFEKIWSAHWDTIFSSLVEASGLGASKKKGLAFFGTLNELRKLAMHPAKAVAMERTSPTQSDGEFLEMIKAAIDRFSRRQRETSTRG